MMSDAIITALIMAAASVICQILINRGNRLKRTEEETTKAKQAAIDEALKAQELNSRLGRIEEKLDIHNGYAEKLTNIEKSIAVIETKVVALEKE